MVYGNISSMQEAARSDSVAVGTSSVRISDPRSVQAPRKAYSIRNTSPNATDIISIAFGLEQAATNEGVVLRQYEIWQESSEATNPCFQGSITAICATATGTVAIFER